MFTPAVMAHVLLGHASVAFVAPFLALQGAWLGDATPRTSDAAQGEVL
jgi:hypothetical protein